MPAKPNHCPHCGRAFNNGRHIALHIAACMDSPNVRARVLAALADPDLAGRARTSTAYEAIAKEVGAPSRSTLMLNYGNWGDLCADFGLLSPYRSRQGRLEESAPAGVNAKIAVARRLRLAAEAAEMERGLPVCGCRLLPNGDIAWMLR